MNWQGLATRLEIKFGGLGQFPLIRKRLYKRLESLVLAGDEQAQRIITECALMATTKQKPGNWFAAAVTRRLCEAGYPASEGTTAVVAAKQLAAKSLADHFTEKEG